MIARIVVSIWFVPIFGFMAICFADQAAWLTAVMYILPTCIYCVKKIEKEFNSWFDSNFDKRYEKALTKARAKWEQEQNQQKAYDDMSDSEKKEFDYNQKQKELDKRLADVTIRENRANVANRLASDGLQASLVDVFKLDDTDSLEDQYEKVSKAFKKAVDDQVQIKLAKSFGAPGGASSGAASTVGARLADTANERTKANKKSDFWS